MPLLPQGLLRTAKRQPPRSARPRSRLCDCHVHQAHQVSGSLGSREVMQKVTAHASRRQAGVYAESTLTSASPHLNLTSSHSTSLYLTSPLLTSPHLTLALLISPLLGVEREHVVHVAAHRRAVNPNATSQRHYWKFSNFHLPHPPSFSWTACA